MTFSSDTQYVSWRSSGGEKGHQLYNPITMTASAREGLVQAGLSIRSGYQDTYQFNDNFASFGILDVGTVSGQTDTVAQLQLQYLGYSKVVPYITLGINIPTGHETLRYELFSPGGDPFAVGNNDVVFLTHFGEGRNVLIGAGGSMLVTTNLTLSLGGTYIFREDYISAHAIDVGGELTYDPGEQAAIVAGLVYQLPQWHFALNTAYRTEDTTESNGTFIGPATFKLGDTVSVDVTARYAWSDQHASTLFGAFTHIADNEVVEFGSPYETKNNDVYEVAFRHDYRLVSWLGLFGRASWRERPSADEFLASRTRLALEGGVEADATNHISGRVSAGYLRVEDDATTFTEEIEIEGWFGTFSTAVRW